MNELKIPARYKAFPRLDRDGKLYISVGLSNKSGFSIVQFKYYANIDSYIEIIQKLDISKEERNLLLTEVEKAHEDAGLNWLNPAPFRPTLSPWNWDSLFWVLNAYLMKKTVGSYGICNWEPSGFLIAFRNKKDQFNFQLKFSECKPVSYWSSKAKFNVFINEGEEFTPVDPDNWNIEDPKGGML